MPRGFDGVGVVVWNHRNKGQGRVVGGGVVVNVNDCVMYFDHV